jgi:outer membrane protein assembly factor BamA
MSLSKPFSLSIGVWSCSTRKKNHKSDINIRQFKISTDFSLRRRIKQAESQVYNKNSIILKK